MVQVVPLSLLVRPSRLIIFRAFSVCVDDYVDELADVKTSILIGPVLGEADKYLTHEYQ